MSVVLLSYRITHSRLIRKLHQKNYRPIKLHITNVKKITEHIRCHLLHRHSVTVSKFIIARIKCWKWRLQTRNPWLCSFLVRSNPLPRIIYHNRQVLECHINLEIYTPYVVACAAGMLLHINGKFIMWKFNPLSCRKVSFSIHPHYQYLGVFQLIRQIQLNNSQYILNYRYSVKGHHLYILEREFKGHVLLRKWQRSQILLCYYMDLEFSWSNSWLATPWPPFLNFILKS